MPNWGSTAYVFKAKDQEQAKDLYDKIDSLSKMTEPLVPNGFGKLWWLLGKSTRRRLEQGLLPWRDYQLHP